MKLSWGVILLMAFVFTVILTVLNLIDSTKTDPTLDQYEVEEIKSSLNTKVFMHLQESRSNISTNSEEIGQGLIIDEIPQ